MFRHDLSTSHRCISRRAAFTLVELLVVIAIIGLLIALLLPSIQSAREAARRTVCTNRQKQLALAAVNYEAAKKTLPVGAHNCCWKTWVVELMPWMENQQMYDIYDHRLYDNGTRYWSDTNRQVTGQLFPELSCPNSPPFITTLGISAHSYLACAGNTGSINTPAGWNTTPPVQQVPPAPAQAEVTFSGAAYVMSGGDSLLSPPENPALFQSAKRTRIAEISDGTTNTLAFSETIKPNRDPEPPSSNEFRGMSWWGPGALFSTYRTPNSSMPDTITTPSYCVDGDPAAPCSRTYHSAENPIALAARSRHPGGVVAARVDGSVSFVPDSVEASVWQALGSTAGNEPIPRQ